MCHVKLQLEASTLAKTSVTRRLIVACTNVIKFAMPESAVHALYPNHRTVSAARRLRLCFAVSPKSLAKRSVEEFSTALITLVTKFATMENVCPVKKIPHE